MFQVCIIVILIIYVINISRIICLYNSLQFPIEKSREVFTAEKSSWTNRS